jgi:RHS repeat-associated protein
MQVRISESAFCDVAVAFILSVILFTSIVGWAQIMDITNTTSPPIPGVGHDYIQMLNETVDPASGSVSLRINVPVPPGRGPTLPFSFAYDTSGVHFPAEPPNINHGYSAWTSNESFIALGGWTYSIPLISGVASYYVKNGFTCDKESNYMFQDSRGGRHSFGRLLLQQSDVNCTGYILTDGDDIYKIALPSAGPGRSPTPSTVVDADGNAFSFSGGCRRFNNSYWSWPCISLPASVEDRNGNQLTILDTGNGAFTVTDTLGRTAISSSGFGTTGNTVAVSGLQNPYTVTWGTANSNFTSTFTRVNAFQNSTCYPPGADSETQSVVTAIALPNSKQYVFNYDPTYGEVSKITYPSGGYVSYAWTTAQLSIFAFPDKEYNGVQDTYPYACQYRYYRPVLQHRYVSFDGSTVALQQDFSYSVTWDANNPGAWDSRQTVVTTHDLVRGSVFTTTYVYSPIAVNAIDAIPLEHMITYKDINGATLRTVTKTWKDQYELQSETIALDNGLTSQTSYQYGSGAQITEKDEYDYGAGSPGPLLRKTVTNYQSFPSTPIFSSGASIFDRPCQTIVDDGSGTRVAEADYYYDGGVTLCAAGTPSVSSVNNLTSHDEANYSAGATAPRGNATKVSSWLNTGGSVSSTYSYDETGQATSITDPCGNGTCSDMTGSTTHLTTYSYADSYTVLSGGQNVSYTPSGNTNALLTTITDPLGHTANFTYDFNNSQLTASTDENQRTAAYVYNDALARPTQTSFPDGGQMTNSYSDAAPSPSVTISKLIDSTASVYLNSTTVMDGVGHVVQTQLTSDPDGTDYVDTTYDGLGRVYTSSNPHRSSAWTTDGATASTYDSLGRTTNVVKPDGSAVTASYTGNLTTMTDEVGNQRTSRADALGRLTTIWEAPNNTGYNYETDYQYDALSNLLCAVQKATDTTAFSSCASAPSTWRPRSFTYDSLSRLTASTNPESGTINYTYDVNGNLSSKVAPKPGQTGTGLVTTNYTYDVLNRVNKKSYVNLSTPQALYGYDGAALSGCGTALPTITNPTNLVGRRSAMCSGKSSSAFSYDQMGRPIERRANRGSSVKTYTINHTYYKDGSINTLTFPSGDVVTYKVGGAARVTQVGDSSNNYVGYSGNTAAYAPTGAIASMVEGHTNTFAGIATSNIYNDRLQPILLSASVASTPIFSLCYDFHLGHAISSSPCQFNSYSTGDNGNVFQVFNNLDSTRSTVFQYDPLNRISQANTITTTGANCWGEAYTIDAWSNLTDRSGVSGMTGCITEGLSTSASGKNQLSGISYDAAGNVTNDGIGNQPTYDAENRIATDAGFTYSYDADGMRMEKSSGTSGTMYWPGPGGAMVAETDLTGTVNEEYIYLNGQRIARVDRPSGTVHYYFSDTLGSAGVIADTSGSVQQRYFYYPYGGIVASIGSDSNHYKFTGKERDSESGLDNFGARYYGSALSRFMSADPVVITPERFYDPQQLNEYAYVRNNPTTLVDPTGMILRLAGNVADATNDLCQIVGAANCSRITVDQSTGIVTFDTKDLDLNANAGASLVNDLVQSQSTYGFSSGPTVETAGGTVKVDYITNLPPTADQLQYRKCQCPTDNETPKKGVADQVAFNPNDTRGVRESLSNLKLAVPYTVAFHELAEAYAKVDGGRKTYDDAHGAAMKREDALRDQRPYLKDYNPGSGGPPGHADTKVIIKNK